NYILDLVKKAGYSEEDYEKKEKEIGPEKMRQVEKVVCLRILDTLWLEHLENMDYLRDSVRLRAYGQRDPLVEYKSEGHKMFQRLLAAIETNIAQTILKVGLTEQSPPRPIQDNPAQVHRPANQIKIGRNDLCPCGSNKKYKRCGFVNSEEHKNNIQNKKQ
ncbi:MAG: SEC-C metal-binding domain-containing protein, partial [bacterium]